MKRGKITFDKMKSKKKNSKCHHVSVQVLFLPNLFKLQKKKITFNKVRPKIISEIFFEISIFDFFTKHLFTLIKEEKVYLKRTH